LKCGVVKDKVWGRTTLIFRTANVEVHYLEIKAGGYCSKHRHVKGKSNLFHIISGRLVVRVWDATGEKLIDSTVLDPGQITVVAPLLWHQFEAVKPTRCYEIYETRVDPGDIERVSEGGIRR